MFSNRLTSHTIICFVFCGYGILSNRYDCLSQNAETTLKIKGTVRDSSTTETLPGATIIDKTCGTVTLVGENGNYQFNATRGKHELICSFVGYKSVSKTIDLSGSAIVNFNLASTSVKVQEVLINSQAQDKQVRNIQSGVIELTRKEIAGLPLFLGESDFYKALQLMPGVQISGEGNAAIYIRGGGYDQNLILLDQATVYNPTHLLGFYSVFNTDVINEVTLIKSGIPAEYGNRISSVLDFASNRSIPEHVKTTGNLGLIRILKKLLIILNESLTLSQ